MNIKKMIKGLIGSTDFGKSLLFSRRYLRDSQFRELIEDYDQSDSILDFKNLGDLNIGKNIYLMRFDSKAWGFFAYWRFSIEGLIFAEKYNLIPVIDWTNNSPYYEDGGVHGVLNPFEYFFEPVSNVTVRDAYQSNSVCFYTIHSSGHRNIKYSDEIDIERYAKICKKYYHLKPDIKTRLTSEINNVLRNRKTLAVQIRGVEWGKIEGHPIPLKLESYVREIDRAICEIGFDQIFLATDSDDTVEYMCERYKGKLVFYKDVCRAKRGSSTLAIFDTTVSRKSNKYLLGYEVLRDMMTLCACDGLVATLSNISLAAEVTKRINDQSYLFKHIFTPQLNESGMSAERAVNLMKRGKFK